ncbi:C40 family peptidase [Chlorogloea sp. CCALA 695]|uniref:C40 family peptidase n=1 Tax=Chlorogloea sp. CCALA 695 TaxID=2107693 RepID=UPI000D061D3B|nr:C40 family peptidase [Chlorogloea sp. CCALA 695]PSB35474.1 glycoside hydrolase [Chlorogloea sp. CCALA 695]
MVSLQEFIANEYICQSDLNIYDTPKGEGLVTQAATGRHLQVISILEDRAMEVRLCEDNYPGWLLAKDLSSLELADSKYNVITFSPMQIKSQLPEVIDFTKQAMQQPNYYLWGGTVAPNYDCSGLMQAAFKSVGVWLPRDAYQQEAFTQKISFEELLPGDLVFFGRAEKATHVGLCLGEACYIHSSGQKQGRNGIGIDKLSEQGDEVSKSYYQQLRGFGRVMSSYGAH